MLSRSYNWIAGTVELASKVRYGITSRGVPIFRFIPYDKRLSPMAVGCSTRDLFYNIHAIVEPVQGATKPNELPRGSIVQYDIPEEEVLLAAYAYDNQKHLRKECPVEISKPEPATDLVFVKEGFTFHIDPPGCRDADDSFTFQKQANGWKVWIHIADVASWIAEGSTLDLNAQQRATTFYTIDGFAVAPMLPRKLSEDILSLSQPGSHVTLSLCFDWTPGHAPTNFTWHQTITECQAHFTYDEAAEEVKSHPELQALRALAKDLGGDVNDSHTWVEMLMILYNKQAGELLKKHGAGILRRQSGLVKKTEPLREYLFKQMNLQFLLNESAEYCLATETHTEHFGLETDAYAYASSPLRRYVDLINQRAIKALLQNKTPTPLSQELVNEMNRRNKQARAFNRDLFYSSILLQETAQAQKANIIPISQGVVLSPPNPKGKIEVYMDTWKRIVKVKTYDYLPEPGTKIQLSWFEDRTQARWKERMVFQLKKENGNPAPPTSSFA